MSFTADSLLEDIKSYGMIPASQVAFDDDDILLACDQVIKRKLVPLYMSLRQDFFVYSEQEATVEDQAAYDIPYRAIGRALRDIKLIDDSSNTRNLTLIPLESAHEYTSSSTSHSFYIKGNQVILVPTPTSADFTIEWWYLLQPSALVKIEDAALVSSATTTVVTVSAVPDGITAGTVVDFVQGTAGGRILAMDKTVTSVTTTTITFASGLIPTDLAAGDYVCVKQQTPVVMLPDEAQPLLAARSLQRILRSIGDFDGAQGLDAEIADAEKDLRALSEPRTQGEPTPAFPRYGLLRGRSSFIGRRGLFSE